MSSDKLGHSPALLPVAADGSSIEPGAETLLEAGHGAGLVATPEPPAAPASVAVALDGPALRMDALAVAADPVEALAAAAESVSPIAAAAPASVPPVADAAPMDPAPIAAPEQGSLFAPAPVAPPRERLPVRHRIYVVALGRKREALQHLLNTEVLEQTLVYTRTKHGADKISRFLERVGFKSAAIHGDKSHGARSRALAGFKAGEIRALVATDIAARGFDIEGLPVVVNYDLPHIAEDYLQRVLRAGSSAGDGLALSIITQEESPQFRAVRSLLGGELELLDLPGFEAAEAFDAERDPPVRVDGDAPPAAAATAEAPARVAQPPRPPRPQGAPQPGRRERGGRNGRAPRPDTVAAGEPLVAGEAAPLVEGEAVVAAIKPERGPRPERVARPERAPRPERKPRVERERGPRPERGGRPDRGVRGDRGDRGPRGERPLVMRGDEQPFGPPESELFPDDAQNFGDDPTNAVDFSEVEGRIERGNSALPQPMARTVDGDNKRRRRNGRPDPFAPVEVNEEQSSIYDERQPEDYRDQWSVLGPAAGRPSWTYADQGAQPAADPRIRSDAQPKVDPGAIFARREAPERRTGAPRAGAPRTGQPRQGQPRGGQPRQGQPRHGRPKRADGR